MTWWNEGRDLYFQLMTLSTPDWDKPESKQFYRSSSFKFAALEIKGHEDCIEEQLWSFRNGLSNVAYDIKLSPHISKKLLRYLRKKRTD